MAVRKKKVTKKVVRKIVKKATKKVAKKKAPKIIKKLVKKVSKKITQKKVLKKKITQLDLRRSFRNPIIKPSEHYWESKATFNPTAFYHDGKVHIIYRAIGETDN